MPYCLICAEENCSCEKDTIARLEESVTTIQVAAHQIRLLRRDRFELIDALKTLIETCPADPDETDDFLDANHRAVELISRLQTKSK